MSTLSQIIKETGFEDRLRAEIESRVAELPGTVIHPAEGEKTAVVTRFTVEGAIRVELLEEEEGDAEGEISFECHGTADLSMTEADGGEYRVAISTPCSGVAALSLPADAEAAGDTALTELVEIDVTVDEVLLDEEAPLDAGVE